MGVATQVTALQNWLNLKSELMEYTDFVHADTSIGKLKVTYAIFGWVWLKMGVII